MKRKEETSKTSQKEKGQVEKKEEKPLAQKHGKQSLEKSIQKLEKSKKLEDTISDRKDKKGQEIISEKATADATDDEPAVSRNRKPAKA